MTHSFFSFAVLFLIGFGASTFGSLVGLGGGFVVVPTLRLVFAFAPALAAGTSLAFVLANAAAASIGFLRRGRVEIGLALWVAAGGIPASLLGVYALRFLTPAGFDLLYGLYLVSLGANVLRNRRRPVMERRAHNEPRKARLIELGTGAMLGFVSSLFGIGGGVVLVPVLLFYFRIPPHAVAATTVFVLFLTTPTGVVAHALAQHIDPFAVVPLALGGVAGGTYAASIADRVAPSRLMTILAIGCFCGALGLAIRHVPH